MGWRDWEADWNDDVLARIVALLFALANLADFAARFPARRRKEALGFLVIGMALDAPIEVDEPVFPDDAASLAARLRVLAFVLWFLLAQDRRLARPAPQTLRRGPVGRSLSAGLSEGRNRRSAMPAPDTS